MNDRYTADDMPALSENLDAIPERTADWRLRNQVYERDNYTCRYCLSDDYPRGWLVADHVIPTPSGPTTLDNLVTACRPCNKRKGPRTPEQAGMALHPVSDTSRTSSHSVTSDASPAIRSSVSSSVGVSALSGAPLRALGPIPVKGMDGTVAEVDVQSEIPADLTRLQKLAEELTGIPYVMANLYGGLGKKVWEEQLTPHGYSSVERAWRGIHNRSLSEGMNPPTLRQLVLGADDVLNPIPAGRETRREITQQDEQSRFDRRVANTRARYGDRP